MEDNKYLGFFISEDSTGRGLAAGLLNYCDKYGIDVNQLIVVGCDGTAVNTGYKVKYFHSYSQCVIRAFGKMLQWK